MWEYVTTINEFHRAAVHHWLLNWELPAVITCKNQEPNVHLFQLIHTDDHWGLTRISKFWEDHCCHNEKQRYNDKHFEQCQSSSVGYYRGRFHRVSKLIPLKALSKRKIFQNLQRVGCAVFVVQKISRNPSRNCGF
jgi:hypothetical protein